MAQEKKTLKKIRSGLFERGYSLAKLTVQAGTQIAGTKMTSLFLNESEKNQKWLEFLKNQSLHLSNELGELKGSLMKAGQMLSMYGEHFLPPEVNEALKKLYADSPPLDWQNIEKIIQQHLSPEKIAELEVDPVAIGSASLGQVHKAKIKKTGEWIALKIQYPGVEKAIESDLKAIRTVLSMMQILPKGNNVNALFAEIRSMMLQEINYRSEAEQTKKYRELLAHDSRFIIPQVYDEYSTDKILATSFESGLSPDSTTVQNLSQNRRNKLAENFLELYIKEFYEWGYVQTDPHLGNYKIRIQPDGNDQLVLLDFGAVRKYESEFLQTYKKMISAALQQDEKALQEATTALQFIGVETSEKIKADFVEFCKTTVEPFRGGIYDFKNSDLPQRLTKSIFKIIRSFEINPPPKDMLFLDRKTGGVYIFMVILGAQFDPKPILKKYIDF